MLRQIQGQRLQQKLSPRQIQFMNMVQLQHLQLDQRIEEELAVNPALEEASTAEQNDPEDDYKDNNQDSSEDALTELTAERDDPFELDEYLQNYIDDDGDSYKTRADGYRADDEDTREAPVLQQHSFHEHLDGQLGMLQLDERQQSIAQQIIGSIDNDGYLRRATAAIVDDLLFTHNIETNQAEVNELLCSIQQFDPPGVGARDLRECLLLQLKQKLEQQDQMPSARYADLWLARRIISRYFDEFSKKHFSRLTQQLEVDEDDLRDAIAEILKLNPKPASGYAPAGRSNEAQYVVPDFIVQMRDGELEVQLNGRSTRELRVSDQYREMLKTYRHSARKRGRATPQEKQAVTFIKNKIDSAKWFIDAIQQRQDTLLRTMYAILEYQYDYFLTGDQKRLRPMILKDIADITQLDISTVSRVTSSKYVQTEFGTFLLKELFSESMTNQQGEEISTLQIKQVLQEIIDAENKRKPLSDEKLMALLQERGYDIARRTVAKYREQLNIPVARLRKEL